MPAFIVTTNEGKFVQTNSSSIRSIFGIGFTTKGITTVEADILPDADGTANLGSPTQRFANLYTQDLHFSNEGTAGNDVDGTTGNWTLQEGHDYIYFINNKTGVKFRVEMEQA